MPELRTSSLTLSARFTRAAGIGAAAALLALSIHVFVAADGLQLASIWILGGSLACLWLAVLTWRMPVPGRRALVLVATAWGVGTALSVWLAGWAHVSRPLVWRLAMQWAALALSLTVGALLLRALYRKRTAPPIGRLVSLVSPLSVVLAIVLSFFDRGP